MPEPGHTTRAPAAWTGRRVGVPCRGESLPTPALAGQPPGVVIWDLGRTDSARAR